MQRVGLQRMARGLFRGMRQRASAEKVDDYRCKNNAECPDGGIDCMALVREQPVGSFPDHYAGQQE